MGIEGLSRPTVVLPATGVAMSGLAVARLASGPVPGAAGPDLSWWGFLRAELIALGIAAVGLPAWAALSRGSGTASCGSPRSGSS